MAWQGTTRYGMAWMLVASAQNSYSDSRRAWLGMARLGTARLGTAPLGMDACRTDIDPIPMISVELGPARQG